MGLSTHIPDDEHIFVFLDYDRAGFVLTGDLARIFELAGFSELPDAAARSGLGALNVELL